MVGLVPSRNVVVVTTSKEGSCGHYYLAGKVVVATTTSKEGSSGHYYSKEGSSVPKKELRPLPATTTHLPIKPSQENG